jgi:5-methylthioribose kinase
MDEIKDPERRALCETRALRAARALLVEHRSFPDMASVIALAQRERARGLS